MEHMICNLCAGTPEIPLYQIILSDEERQYLNRINPIILTDICIGLEIQALIKAGVKTYGCCCGHGISFPECLVSLDHKELLKSLGYEIHDYTEKHTNEGIVEIYLKTDVQRELRDLLRMED